MIFRRIQHGYTLLEIVITLVIIGILSTVGLPKLFSLVQRFRAREGETVLYAVHASQKRYYTDEDEFTNDIEKLDVSFSQLKYFDIPKALEDPNSVQERDNPDIIEDNDYDDWLLADVGSVAHQSGTYTLYITNDGEIHCEDNEADGDGDGSGCDRIRY